MNKTQEREVTTEPNSDLCESYEIKKRIEKPVQTPEYLHKRDIFIEKNLGLVHLLAHKFKGRGIEYDDLYQAGCIGLIKAYDCFDNTRGVMFSTYAVPVILGEIKRLFRDGGTVKVSRSLKETAIKINRIKNVLSIKLGRDPTINEIAQELEISPEQVIEGLNASLPVASLTENSNSKEDGDSGQIDLPVVSHETEVTDKISIENAIMTLDENDRKIVYLRFYQGKTQCETAQLLEMTQVQVSRREKKILLLLRKNLA